MRLKRSLICLLYFIFLCDIAVASPKLQQTTERLTWFKNDAPPFYIHRRINVSGFGDTIQRLIERRLDRYEHETEIIPISRLSLEWGKYSPACFATMIHPRPINDQYILSNPTNIYMPHGLITTPGFAETLDLEQDGSVSLKKLLKHSHVNFGHIKGRTYGQLIDQLLVNYQDNVELTERAGATETEGVLKMLEAHRFDAIIEYEFILNYHLSLGSVSDELVFIPISELKHTYISGAIGCSNTDKGRQVIEEINAVLPEMIESQSYRRSVNFWLVPAGNELKYWTMFKDAFGSHTSDQDVRQDTNSQHLEEGISFPCYP